MNSETNLIGNLQNNFNFTLPTQIEFGIGVSHHIGRAISHFEGKNVFVVTDPGVRRAGLVEPIVKLLNKADLRFTIYDEIEANPSNTTVDRAAQIARDQKTDTIVAIGGGSSIDAAKGIAVVAGSGGYILDYEGMDLVPRSALPLIAIPTTAGTGSEVTIWAVITDPNRKIKTAVGSQFIAPRMALIDPELTTSLPPDITAATGIDALTHAIEAFTARCANPVSDALALYAIELIGKHLENATADGQNLEARSGMILGSLLAGMAFGNSDTAAVHSLAEALGGMFNVPHGVANAIFLPYVMGFNIPVVTERIQRIGKALGFEGPCEEGTEISEAAMATVDHIYKWISHFKLPRLIDTGITPGDIEPLAKNAFHNLGTPDNARSIDKNDFAILLKMALDDKAPV